MVYSDDCRNVYILTIFGEYTAYDFVKYSFEFMIIMYVYLYIVPSVNLFLVADSLPQLINLLDISDSGNGYGFYLVLGYCTKRWETNLDKALKKPVVISGIIGMLFCNYIWTIYTQIMLYAKQNQYNVWYNYFSIPLIGLAWFLLLKNVKLKNGSVSSRSCLCVPLGYIYYIDRCK